MRVTHRLMETTIAACLGTALLLLSSLTAVAGQPGGPDFTPGFYRVTPVDRNSRASEKPQMLCAADAQALLRLGPGNASGCHRSEERRVGNEGVRTCRWRWWAEH